ESDSAASFSPRHRGNSTPPASSPHPHHKTLPRQGERQAPDLVPVLDGLFWGSAVALLVLRANQREERMETEAGCAVIETVGVWRPV
ncbi:Uncharacterized protein DAT39_015694, partial [Clarias magur]